MADTNLEIVISGRDNFSGTANRVIGSLNGINSAAGRVGRGVGQLGMGFARVGATAGVALAGGLAYAAKQAISFEDAFAGVRKTADLSEAEFTKLAGSFRKMATEIPITANELARLGETAGALGITGVENIREFSRVTALLGVTTNLTADAAAESLGHISTILGITGKDYERFASALVDLGNKGASTEDQIAAIAERAAGGASTVKLSTQALLGWSAAIANIGVEAEAGGTNFQKFLIESARFTAEAGDELQTLAKVAGMTGDAWRKQFGTDPNSALTQFVVGLGKLNTEQRILALGTLGWDDQRMARILLGLASNTGNLTSALQTSGSAWQANTALSIEAGKRFDTLKSKLTVLRNNVVEAAMIVGEGFTPAIGRAAEKLTKFLGDEGNRNSLRQFGEDIGRAIDGINWGEVIAGAKTFWTITKSILDVLMALPNEVKAAGAAFLGLNKLSGGLIGQGVGNIVGGLAGGAARGAAAKVPGIGSIFAQPVYVTNWPLGGLGGGTGVVGGGGLLGKILKVAVVGAVAVEGFGLWAQSITDAVNRNQTLKDAGLTPKEIEAQKFFTGDAAWREAQFKHTGRMPTQADLESGTAKLTAPSAGAPPGVTRRAPDRTYDALERTRLNRPEIKNDIRLNPVTNVTVNLSWRDIQTKVTTQSRIGPATGSAGRRSLAFSPS